MRNPRLEEAQAGIEIAGRNINNLRYAEDTTLMAESVIYSITVRIDQITVNPFYFIIFGEMWKLYFRGRVYYTI